MGKEACLTAGVHFLQQLNPWVSMHVNYDDEIGRKNHNDFKGNDDRHN